MELQEVYISLRLPISKVDVIVFYGTPNVE